MVSFRLNFVARMLAVCALTLALVPASAGAQQAVPAVPPPSVPVLPPGPLTLEQVLDVAAARSESIALAQAALRRAEGEQVRARSGLFPQLALTAGYDRTLATQFSGIFTAPDPAPDPDPDAPDGDGGADDGFANLPFGRLNTWQVSLAFTQNIYTGGRLGAQQELASLGRTAADLGLTTARAQLLFDVTQAYYDAALSDRLVAIAEATLTQAGATLQQVQAGFDAGTQPEFEVLRARVNRDNQQPLLIRQRVARDIAMLRLKQMLDLPPDTNLQLADSLGDQRLAPPPTFAERVGAVERTMTGAEPAFVALPVQAPMPNRTAITEAETAVRVSEASLKLTEAARMPQIAVSSAYQRIAYPTGVFPTFDLTNWTVGAAVQVPILTGGRQRGDELVAKADVEQARIRLRQVEELAAVDTRSAWAELLAARASWEASTGTIDQATRAYDIADVRYRNGVSTQLELTDARLLLQQAEANRAQAARDLQVARARVALLPDLPIGAGANAAGAFAQAAGAARPGTQAPSQQGGSQQFRNASVQQGAGAQTGTR